VGTLLGLVAVAVLQNGLRLADLPSELAGILVGVLLVSALLANQALIKKGGRP
jgi:rhamnose transport system permease protein